MSIKIPHAALEAGARTIYRVFTEVNIGGGEDCWDCLPPRYRTEYGAQARAAFLAIVEAWPGMETGLFAKGERDNVLALILPLTENTDDKT